MKTSDASTLKVWNVTKIGSSQLGIECPHKDCKGKARVSREKWLRLKSEFIGRSCTYCFKTSRIPEGL